MSTMTGRDPEAWQPKTMPLSASQPVGPASEAKLPSAISDSGAVPFRPEPEELVDTEVARAYLNKAIPFQMAISKGLEEAHEACASEENDGYSEVLGRLQAEARHHLLNMRAIYKKQFGQHNDDEWKFLAREVSAKLI